MMFVSFPPSFARARETSGYEAGSLSSRETQKLDYTQKVVNSSKKLVADVIAFILLHEKFLQFDWLRAGVFHLNLKYPHVKITNLSRVVV